MLANKSERVFLDEQGIPGFVDQSVNVPEPHGIPLPALAILCVLFFCENVVTLGK